MLELEWAVVMELVISLLVCTGASPGNGLETAVEGGTGLVLFILCMVRCLFCISPRNTGTLCFRNTVE